jgi:hypothetical protein
LQAPSGLKRDDLLGSRPEVFPSEAELGRFQAFNRRVRAGETVMRVSVISTAVFFALGSLGYGQTQPQQLKGVYGPPGGSAPSLVSRRPSPGRA